MGIGAPAFKHTINVGQICHRLKCYGSIMTLIRGIYLEIYSIFCNTEVNGDVLISLRVRLYQVRLEY